MTTLRRLAAGAALIALGGSAPPARDYLVFVASESADSIALVRFGPRGIAVERKQYVGSMRNENAGPHGVAVSPDGAHYFVSIAHGMPYGSLQKFNARTGALEGTVALGSFPATVQVSPDGFYAFVSNFNVHGDMVPSSVSVVAADQMTEIARIETCVMPHGSRLTADGKKHYSTCMMDEALIEIDARTMAASRHFLLTAGKERGGKGPLSRSPMTHVANGHGMDALALGDSACQPTWAQPSANGARVWVACNKSSEIVEIDANTWTVARRIPVRPGVYNLALTHDGTRLLTTNKRDQSMSIIDVTTGGELARVPTTRKVVSGIAVSDDDRYAFVTDEGSGAQPGTVDVIDLTTRAKVASIDVGAQAGGIDFWKSEPATGTQAQGDPRVGLRAGWLDAGRAISNLELVSFTPRPPGFFNEKNLGDFGVINSDLAFKGNYIVQGNFHGFQIWDASDPTKLTLRSTVECPGGQVDPSIYKNLLFIASEMPNGRVDCGTQGVKDSVSKDRFRGVRIYDISDIDHPKPIVAVQTCRGAHTQTLVIDPKDKANVYIYGSGTFAVRSPNELAGCSGRPPSEDPNTSLFSIDVIKVPIAKPQNARLISSPRVFADSGRVAGLWPGGNHGEGTQTTGVTDQCHDITVYSQIGLAAGACSGNGILLDIRDPAKPKRVAEVSDPNFAYWHSATFNNDGTTVIFTDEWGGGQGARCRATDKREWGADAIYKLSGRTLTQVSSYKLPAVQTAEENCVAHNGSLIPVPGRDIMVQSWYQGGISVFDFTDATHPVEIAYFDRGPLDSTKLVSSGGSWGAYWYNGHIVSSEIARGIDILRLTPSDHLSQNEIDAAKSVTLDVFNPQTQERIVWPASYSVARAYLDQLARNDGMTAARREAVARELDRTEGLRVAERRLALEKLAVQLDRESKGERDAARVRALANAVRALAGKRS